MLKKLPVKKIVAVLALVMAIVATGFTLGYKKDALWFALIHTKETEFAKTRYEQVHKEADKAYMEVMASPLSPVPNEAK